ncbi:MAG: O-antigen ligase family protein, partial [Sideroxyarcus sp.]|nr:O-antigen ligase family protein [Sideroxyarcus sp.]
AARREVMIALAACTLGIALLNWLEFFYPLATNAFDCRAVGTYINPNSAAYALVFGMLAGLRAFSDRARAWFVVIIGISILPTYSRSGMIIYLGAMLVLLASGMVCWRRLMRPALAGIVATALLFSLAFMNVAGRLDCVSHAVVDRAKVIFAFSADRVESDFSTQERIFLLRNAFSAYRANWLFGEGLGATWVQGNGQRTHNIYLEKGIEMGVIGLLLWPAFLLLLMFSCHGQSRQLACVLLSSGLALGLFSHNLFESRQIVIAAALLLVTSTEKQPI